MRIILSLSLPLSLFVSPPLLLIHSFSSDHSTAPRRRSSHNAESLWKCAHGRFWGASALLACSHYSVPVLLYPRALFFYRFLFFFFFFPDIYSFYSFPLYIYIFPFFVFLPLPSITHSFFISFSFTMFNWPLSSSCFLCFRVTDRFAWPQARESCIRPGLLHNRIIDQLVCHTLPGIRCGLPLLWALLIGFFVPQHRLNGLLILWGNPRRVHREKMEKRYHFTSLDALYKLNL